MNTRVHEALRRALRIGAPVALAMALGAGGGDALAGAPAHCVSVDVPAPVILPDGSIHPAGELMLCLTQNYNPVTGLHKVYVNRRPVTMLRSRAARAEMPKKSPPTVLFHGSLASGLRLVGYTVPANGKVFSYLIWNDRAAHRDEVASGSSDIGDGATMGESESFLLAARVE